MTASPESTRSGAAPPIGDGAPASTVTIVASKAGTSANVLTKVSAKGAGGGARDGGRRDQPGPRPADRQQHQHGEAGMGENERAKEPQPGRGVRAGDPGDAQPVDHRRDGRSPAR